MAKSQLKQSTEAPSQASQRGKKPSAQDRDAGGDGVRRVGKSSTQKLGRSQGGAGGADEGVRNAPPRKHHRG